MRTHLIFAVAVLAVLVGVPSNRAAAGRDSLVASEKSMWEMWKQKDAKSFAALLADDFYDVYLSGETAGKKELMKGFGDSELLAYDLSPIKMVAVAPDVRVLLYRAHIRGRVGGKELEYDVDVTSAWSPRNGTWKSVFYRENLVPKTLPWTKL